MTTTSITKALRANDEHGKPTRAGRLIVAAMCAVSGGTLLAVMEAGKAAGLLP